MENCHTYANLNSHMQSPSKAQYIIRWKYIYGPYIYMLIVEHERPSISSHTSSDGRTQPPLARVHVLCQQIEEYGWKSSPVWRHEEIHTRKSRLAYVRTYDRWMDQQCCEEKNGQKAICTCSTRLLTEKLLVDVSSLKKMGSREKLYFQLTFSSQRKNINDDETERLWFGVWSHTSNCSLLS